MSFTNLNAEELAKVAEFFAVDVVAAKPEKPSKRELLASLAAGEEPVTWEQYQTLYLKAQAPAVEIEEPDGTQAVETPAVPVEPVKKDTVLKMERANGRFDIRGYTFTRDHPYRPVTEQDADWIIMNVEGFRRATTQEVSDYYS